MTATRTNVTIETKDGKCPASVFRPDGGAKPMPGVLLYMDGIGIRPGIWAVGEKLAELGYVVLLPDLFYRAGPYEPLEPAKLFTDVEFRNTWFAKYASTASPAHVMSDTPAFLDFLAADSDVRKGKLGVTGYCMGGRLALFAAGHFGGRVAAAASFHGSRLATDDPDSPHLLAPKMKGVKVYVAGAIEDASFPDDQKQRLDEALTAAGVDHTVLTYPAKHGWVPPDTPVHDPAQAARHYEALRELFGATLG
jgi:carboxymethylenebutenolidase